MQIWIGRGIGILWPALYNRGEVYLCRNSTQISGRFRFHQHICIGSVTKTSSGTTLPGSAKNGMEREASKQKALTHVRKIIDEELTAIQRHCVMLYFFDGRTQEQIAVTLGISRRVVSQHLFGVKRKGKRVGGAINKIRKVCVKRGISL